MRIAPVRMLRTDQAPSCFTSCQIQHNIILALRAHNLMFRDKDYVVKDDEVLIVDEFTGRIMPGRRYSDGLHQAIEAKEHVNSGLAGRSSLDQTADRTGQPAA